MSTFQIGDLVQVTHPTCGQWVGKVLSKTPVDDTWEYATSNAPYVIPGLSVLAWECEMVLYSAKGEM